MKGRNWASFKKFTGGRLGCYIEISIFTPLILWRKHYSDQILDHYLSTSCSFISWLALPDRHTVLQNHTHKTTFHHGEPWPTPIKIYFKYIKWWLNKTDFCRRREGSRDIKWFEKPSKNVDFFRHRQTTQRPEIMKRPPKLFNSIIHLLMAKFIN